jgi:CheY-like chemotaxis protein
MLIGKWFMAKHRALVAEDDALILLGLEMILEDSGIEIAGTASTLAEALQLARSVEADVAILDVNLQNELVFPAADLLLERDIPMIFTTGDTLGAKMPARFSATQTVEKPYEADELLRALEAAIASVKLS